MTPIIIEIDGEKFQATLDDKAAPDTVSKIRQALPIQAKINKWGDEFYFRIPVNADLEQAVESVTVGDLAFWPDGSAFCIFFGKTPLSKSEHEIIPASAVNPVGRIESTEGLKKFSGGETIKIKLDDKE
jgi:uncharacterized protein